MASHQTDRRFKHKGNYAATTKSWNSDPNSRKTFVKKYDKSGNAQKNEYTNNSVGRSFPHDLDTHNQPKFGKHKRNFDSVTEQTQDINNIVEAVRVKDHVVEEGIDLSDSDDIDEEDDEDVIDNEAESKQYVC